MNESSYFDADWLELDWSEWHRLDADNSRYKDMPTTAGLYRVRHQHRFGLEYIGQTGRSLRGRVQSLRNGTYAEEMPYSDPHTAAPCLWALREEHGPELEVSVAAPAEATAKQERYGMEEALIACYRREAGESPTANFGRIIQGYEKSRSRSTGDRGGKRPAGNERTQNEIPGRGPLPWTDREEVLSTNWMGLEWTEPTRLGDVSTDVPADSGVYMIWDSDDPLPLEYIGQSANIRSRLRTHNRNRDSELHFRYGLLDGHDHQHERSEVETDLLGAHWLIVGSSPRDQF